MKYFLSTLLFLNLAYSGDVFAFSENEKDLSKVLSASKKINSSAAQSQEKIDQIAEQIDTKLQQFKVLNKEIDGLTIYNTQLQKQIDNQNVEMQNLNSAIDEVSVIERQITPLMMNMISGLEQFVALDVPFLPEERQNRLAQLRSMMDRADVAPSEKFRRVMEAFQVEMEYGRTLEAYAGVQLVDGQEREVEFLRLGRTALVYQTRDGSVQGVWNNQSRAWETLDASYRTQITKGLRMAKKQLAPDLLMLPVALTN